MELRLQIHRDQAGTWSIKGLPQQSVARFDDLSEALEYAKRECAWAPTLIEFFVDGVYVVVNQGDGWPHRLCRPASAPKFAGISDHLRRCRDRWDARPLFSFCRRNWGKTRASRFVAGIASAFRVSQASKT
jgi:hypothetical protein